jgi:hypothetical protein
MVQVLEKKELYIVLPVIEEEAEKVEKVEKLVNKKKIRLGKHTKQHEGRININKVKSYAEAKVYRAGFYPR